MALRDSTLYDLVESYREHHESKSLPSSLESDVRYCSQKLFAVRNGTVDDFDAVMAQYSTLGSRLKSAIGLRTDAFTRMIEELQEAYYTR